MRDWVELGADDVATVPRGDDCRRAAAEERVAHDVPGLRDAAEEALEARLGLPPVVPSRPPSSSMTSRRMWPSVGVAP